MTCSLHLIFFSLLLELQLPAGTKLWVIGWGATMEGGPVVNVLRDVQVTVLSHSACQTAYPNQYRSDRMFCVGDQSGGKDACQVSDWLLCRQVFK